MFGVQRVKAKSQYLFFRRNHKCWRLRSLNAHVVLDKNFRRWENIRRHYAGKCYGKGGKFFSNYTNGWYYDGCGLPDLKTWVLSIKLLFISTLKVGIYVNKSTCLQEPKYNIRTEVVNVSRRQLKPRAEKYFQNIWGQLRWLTLIIQEPCIK